MRHARINEADVVRLGELTKREIQVYIFLALCADRQGRAHPSRSMIAARTGVAKPHVSDAISALKVKGWIGEENRSAFVLKSYQNGNQEVTESVTKSYQNGNKSYRIGNLHHIEQSINMDLNKIDLLIDAFVEFRGNEKEDRRLVTIGVLKTLIRRKELDITEPIQSLAYFNPETDKMISDYAKAPLGSMALEAMIFARRKDLFGAAEAERTIGK